MGMWGIKGIKGFHGWFRFGKKNVEGEMILEFADTLNFAICYLQTHGSRKTRCTSIF